MNPTPDSVEALYERFPYPPSGREGKLWKRRYGRLLDEGARLAGLLTGTNPSAVEGAVLDAGCGTGAKLAGLARALPNARVVGLDRSEASLAVARQVLAEEGQDRITLVRADLEEGTAVRDLGPFDGILCDGVLHHLQQPGAAFGHLASLLATDGALYISVFSRTGRPREARAAELVRAAGPGEAMEDELRLARSLLGLEGLVDPRHAKYYENDAFLADGLLHPRETWFDLPWIAARFAEEGLVFHTWPEGEKHLPALEEALERGGVDTRAHSRNDLLHLVELWRAPALVSGLGSRCP